MLLRQIHSFLAVAEHRGFTRAAAALHVSQPALSQQIRQLEEALGAQLFERSGRATRLTDAGEVYLRHARRALRDLAEGRRALQDLGELGSGSLRIAATPNFTTYLAGPLVASFHARYPNVSLTLNELPQERIEAQLADGELDLGIGFRDAVPADIDAQPLLDETLALVVGRSHPLARRRRAGPDTLDGLTLVLLASEFATRERIDRALRRNAIRPRVLVESNSLNAVIEIVRHAGLATLLPSGIAGSRPDLAALVLDPPLLRRSAALLRRKDAYRTAAARAFEQVATEVCGAGAARVRRRESSNL